MKKKKQKVIRMRLIPFIAICIVFIYGASVMGRYVINHVNDLYLISKSFYFTSNLLTINSPTYTLSNWGGTDTYNIDLKLNSYQNESLKLDRNLNYNISASTDSTKVKCAIGSVDGESSATGTILSTTNTVEQVVYIVPIETISESDEIEVTIRAQAYGEYNKTISAKFKFNIKNLGSTMLIEDTAGSEYASLILKNTNANGTNVTLQFDPEDLRIDMNDDAYINKSSYETKTIDGVEYVKKITFTAGAEETKKIKFYKVDKQEDYTYPNGDSDSVIQITYS